MPKPDLRPGEQAIQTYPANRTQGWRAVGGHLVLTDQRVCFYPHIVDRATGGKSWECDLKSISSVGVEPRGRHQFNGSLRPRLRIDCAGALEFFVVRDVPAIAAAIEQATETV